MVAKFRPLERAKPSVRRVEELHGHGNMGIDSTSTSDRNFGAGLSEVGVVWHVGKNEDNGVV